jgi:hypothetical protein
MPLTGARDENERVYNRAHAEPLEDAMSLRFIGIDPHTGQGESPTVWVDESRGELVIQGWKPDAETAAECASFQAPGHAAGIPETEQVVRVPARMVSILREACDVAERAQLR